MVRVFSLLNRMRKSSTGNPFFVRLWSVGRMRKKSANLRESRSLRIRKSFGLARLLPSGVARSTNRVRFSSLAAPSGRRGYTQVLRIRKAEGLASALSASIFSTSIPPTHPTRNGNLTQKIGTHTHEGLIQKIRQHFFQSGRPRRGRRRRLAGAEGGRLKKCDWRIWRRAKPDAFAKIRGFFSHPAH